MTIAVDLGRKATKQTNKFKLLSNIIESYHCGHISHTVKPVLKGHSKIGKTKDLRQMVAK